MCVREVKFCGRIFRPEGVSHDPNRIKALCAMNIPEKANELQQLLMASQWMSRSIPEYNKLVSPLQGIFQLAMKNQPKRTNPVARGVKLKQFGWNVNHTLAVERLKLALANAVQLSYPNEKCCNAYSVTRVIIAAVEWLLRELNDTIYMNTPSGSRLRSKVVKLLKALYGLK